MTSTILPRLGAACGAIFAIVLFVASGNGSGAFSAPRAIAGLAALTLFVPFLAYLCSLLREAEGPNGIVLKIASVTRRSPSTGRTSPTAPPCTSCSTPSTAA
jgi:hypothetical protein